MNNGHALTQALISKLFHDSQALLDFPSHCLPIYWELSHVLRQEAVVVDATGLW